jgi:serine O-acetyltransferase
MFNTIRNDIQAALERDPAARNWLEVLLCYAGVHALWGHRVTHWFWKHRLKLFARWLAQINRFFTGIEIHPGAKIGEGVFIDHGMGVVIGETAEIGKDVTLYHGVTLGGVSLKKGKRHPTLEEGVVVGAGAQILGAITLGECSRIGANAVVVESVPRDSVVVGVPGRVVEHKAHRQNMVPDLNHNKMPDTVGDTLTLIMQRLEAIEKRYEQEEKTIMNSVEDWSI